MTEEEELPADAEQEEAPDPYEGLTEEQRTRLTAHYDAQVQAEAQRLKDASEAELQRHKSEIGTRLKERAFDYAGIEFDEHNQPKLKDPTRMMGLLAGATQAKPAEDPRPDPVYDPDGFAAWSERQADKKAEERMAPVLREMQALRGMIVQREVQGVENEGRAALESYGLDQWAEHPDFTARYRENLGQLPPEALRNPEAIRLAALGAIARLDPAAAPKRSATEEKPRDDRSGRYLPQDLSRAGMAQASASRGGGQRQEGRYNAEFVEAAQDAGMSPEEWERYGPGGDPYAVPATKGKR